MCAECVEVSGSYREMGRQHGEALREGAEQMCEIRIELSLQRARQCRPDYQVGDLLELAGEHLVYHERYCPDTHEEFLGICEGGNIEPERLLIGNGYTDYVDVVTAGLAGTCECTHIAAGPPATADGMLYLGQTWDMDFAAAEYVICIRRKPKNGPATIGITTAGCLSLIAINEAGIAIGNTNLISNDARPGVIYLATINNALGEATFDEAVGAIKEAPRASGHHFYIGGPQRQMVGLETSATAAAELGPDGCGVYAHTNHYISEQMRQYEGTQAPSVNSIDRQGRAQQLLHEKCGDLDVSGMMEILSDHAGENRICRHTDNPSEAASLAAVIMAPEKGQMSFTIGNSCERAFTNLCI